MRKGESDPSFFCYGGKAECQNRWKSETQEGATSWRGTSAVHQLVAFPRVSRLVLAAVWGSGGSPGAKARRSVRRQAGTIGRWGVHLYGKRWVRWCFLPIGAASQQASPPTSPVAHRRSDPGVRTTVPSLHCRARWSSRSRTHGPRAAGSIPAYQTRRTERWLRLAPSTRERSSP